MYSRTKLVAVAAAVAALVGGGAAVASGQAGFDDDQDAVLEAAADELGVEPAALSTALVNALSVRIDAAVAAGTFTAQQGAELKQRLAEGGVPLFGLPHGPGGPGHHGFGHVGSLDAAATFLGLTEEELRGALADGSTLTEVAEAEGKSVAGLEAAMLAAAKEDLAAAVEDGRLTAAQRQEILADLPARIADLVDRSFDRGPGHGWGGHPPAGAPDGEADA